MLKFDGHSCGRNWFLLPFMLLPTPFVRKAASVWTVGHLEIETDADAIGRPSTTMTR